MAAKLPYLFLILLLFAPLADDAVALAGLDVPADWCESVDNDDDALSLTFSVRKERSAELGRTSGESIVAGEWPVLRVISDRSVPVWGANAPIYLLNMSFQC